MKAINPFSAISDGCGMNASVNNGYLVSCKSLTGRPGWRIRLSSSLVYIGQFFREFEPCRVRTRINSLGLFLAHKLTCRKARERELASFDEKIDEQWDC